MKSVCRNIIISILFVTFFYAGGISAQEKEATPVSKDKISTDTTVREPETVERSTEKKDSPDTGKKPELKDPEKSDRTDGEKKPAATVEKKMDSGSAADPDKEKTVPDAEKKAGTVSEPVRKTGPETQDEPKKTGVVQGRDSINSGLLSVPDNDIRYLRIPEYRADKSKPDNKNFVTIPSEKEKVDAAKDEFSEEGLFGLSREKTDLIARGSLVLLILVIFVLYRTRSKSSDRKVLRRFPKK